MNAEALSALVYTSPDPERLASFYRQHLGIPFEHQSHGPIRDHLEAWFGGGPGEGIHFAILKGKGPGPERGSVAPTFLVKALDAHLAGLKAAGVEPLHAIADLSEGKRLASFSDVDGNLFRLIDLGTQTGP